MELATLQWVSWFNHHRLLEPIGYIPPAEAEANYYRQLANQASRRRSVAHVMRGGLHRTGSEGRAGGSLFPT